MVKTKGKISFFTRVRKHAKSTWRVLIPVAVVKQIDMRKPVKVTISQDNGVAKGDEE